MFDRLLNRLQTSNAIEFQSKYGPECSMLAAFWGKNYERETSLELGRIDGKSRAFYMNVRFW